jgi:PAS domain S-box-containing protein
VLADVMMPRLDGFGLLRALRADDRTRLIPVLLLSARAGEESHVEGLGAGADDYLVKPFSARELLARVDAHLELARVRADAAERLRDAQQRLQLALSAARTVAWQWDEATGAVRWSGNVQAVLGIPTDAPSDRSAFVSALVHPDDLPHLLAAIREGMARCSDYQGQVRMTRPDTGATIWVEVYGRCSGDASGTPVRLDGVVVDITERKQAEALLADRRSEAERAYAQAEAERARLQQVLDVLPAGVAIANSDGQFALSNRAAREMLGFDVAGQAMPVTDSGAYEEYGAHRSDGTPIPSAELPLQRAVLRGETVRGDRFFMRNARTGRDVPVLANSAPLLTGEGQQTGGIVVFQDITAIYDLERQKDAFLSAASHDLQQPVAAIKGNAQLLRRWLTRDGPADHDRLLTGLGHVEKATERLADQIAELLDVSRLQMGRPLDLHRSPTDLVTLAQQTVSDYRVAGEDHDWRLEAQIASLVADVDAARLRRVLDNLLSNAVKFSPAGTEIVVTIDREAVEGREWAVLAVRDRGMGIPAADLPRVFERFYRASNAAGQIAGTGIGLAGARHIVEQHGGSLVAVSVEGDGATFAVRLPLQTPG